MKLVETAVRNRELHLGKVAVEQVHVVPRDDLLVDALAEKPAYGHYRALEKGMQAAQNTAYAHFRTQKAQLSARLRELEVVYAHDLHALRVDDLLVEQVARKQNLVRLQVAEANVVGLDGKRDAALAEFVDVFAPRDHERHAAGALESKACNSRKHLAGGDGEVGDSADFFARRIDDRLSQHLRQIEHGCPLTLSCACGCTSGTIPY